MPRIALRSIAIAFVVALSACVSWAPVSTTNPDTHLPSPVRVILKHGDTLSLRDARIVGDALVGQRKKIGQTSVPMIQVGQLERLAVSRQRTILALIGAGLLAGLVYENTRPKCTNCINLF
jgi:hypothetical protein